MTRRLKLPGPVAFLVLASACDLPRDSNGTLDHLKRRPIRVGFVVDTPWVTDSAGAAGGIEADLVQSLARGIGTRIEWVPGQESALLESLKERELDLVIGGLTARSPWKNELAFTRPYYVDTVLVAGAQGSAPPSTIAKAHVGVRRGDPIAVEIRKKDATPVPVERLELHNGPIAAPTWKLDRLTRIGNKELAIAQQPHVLAAPPGENAWLVRIEQMLIERRDAVPQMLRSMPR